MYVLDLSTDRFFWGEPEPDSEPQPDSTIDVGCHQRVGQVSRFRCPAVYTVVALSRYVANAEQ
jgi:hypothetical protein